MRLLNAIFENSDFLIDDESTPYIVRDIINMNWWNTCDYLLGYKNNRRVSLTPPTHRMKLIAIILKEFYRYNQNSKKNEYKLKQELHKYISGQNNYLQQLKLFSMDYRRNDSQYFYKNGKPTWLDCTSRATYAWKYVAQNGYIDFDGVCRVIDGEKIIKHCKEDSDYSYENCMDLFCQGENKVKLEIFSQRVNQMTVAQWVESLGIDVIKSREWLFKEIRHVKTDPYKNNEKKLLKEGKLIGNNELLYGYRTFGVYVDDSIKNSTEISSNNISRASAASHAIRASYACNASGESRASDASSASHASSAGIINTDKSFLSWENVPTAIGKIDGLDFPPVFKKNKYGIAGHWKINEKLVESCNVGWFDPFMGHGESPLCARRMNKKYVGIEINEAAMNSYLLPYVQSAINEKNNLFNTQNVEMRLGDSSIFMPDLVNKFDLCYTSPPYFDFEDYGYFNKTIIDCENYDEYHQRVTVPVFSNVYKYLIDSGCLALQTEKNKTLKNKWIDVICSIGFVLISNTITGQEKNKYSNLARRDQTLLIFEKNKT